MEILSKLNAELSSRYQTTIDSIEFNGQIKRFGEKSHLWASAKEWNYKGQDYQAINFGSWKDGETHTVKSYDPSTVSIQVKKQASKIIKEMAANEKIEKQKKHEECKKKWKPLFKKGFKIEHGYLDMKKVEMFCTRTDKSDVLMIPAYNQNGFVGVQRIMQDAQGNYIKRYSSGIEKKGAFCHLKEFKLSNLVYVSEGFATAATIQMAMPLYPSICCFDANNITDAIKSIRALNPECKIIICADDDENKIGEKKAKLAVKHLANVAYKLPKFSEKNGQTDFNDLHVSEGLKKVKDQIKQDGTEFKKIIPLGVSDGNFYYMTNELKRIVTLKSQAHGPKGFKELLSNSYFQKHYPKMEDDEVTGINWEWAEDDLKEKCRNEGIFDPKAIRGKGVWLDDGRIVVNTGSKTYLNNVVTDEFKTNYYYVNSKKMNYDPSLKIDRENIKQMIGFFEALNFKSETDYIYMAAWVMQANIFTCLPWRPHIWLSGERGTGKSTVLKWINSFVINSELNEDSTQAGIQQSVKNDAMAIIYDESEPSSKRLDPIITMARQCSSNNSAATHRGTVSGQSLTYQTELNFLMGSIQKGDLSKADISRFYQIELLQNHGQTAKEFATLESFVEFYQKNLKDSFFTYCVSEIPSVLKNMAKIKTFLRSTEIGARQADQYSITAACFFSMGWGGLIEDDLIEPLIEMMEIGKTNYQEENKESDSVDCLASLLELEVEQGLTVAGAIEMINGGSEGVEYSEKRIAVLGIKYSKKKNTLFIAANNINLKSKMAKMTKFPDYATLLKRLPDSKYKPMRILGQLKKGVEINKFSSIFKSYPD